MQICMPCSIKFVLNVIIVCGVCVCVSMCICMHVHLLHERNCVYVCTTCAVCVGDMCVGDCV